MLKRKIYCPSSYLKAGAKIIAVKNEKGEMKLINNSIFITKDIKEMLEKQPLVLESVRISNPCEEKRCKHWDGYNCHAIKMGIDFHLSQKIEIESQNRFLKCSVNLKCRWYLQEGLNACAICDKLEYYKYD